MSSGLSVDPSDSVTCGGSGSWDLAVNPARSAQEGARSSAWVKEKKGRV